MRDSEAREPRVARVQHQAKRKKLIQGMLSMGEQGVSYRKIAKWLESKGIPAPSGKMKWYAGTLKAILKRASPTNDVVT